MTEREIQRWTREVAEDPGAPSFVRLARAYRAQGRRKAARDVVLRGLEHNPEHIGAHGLLALIHVEDGERQKAGDEWETVLRLEPGNFDASRGLGFLALERGDLPAARRHLETAADARPDDPAVEQALKVLERREGQPTAAAGPPPGEPAGEPRSAVGERRSVVGEPRSAVGGRQSAVGGRQSAVGGRQSAVGSRRSAVGKRRSAVGEAAAHDPSRLFEPLAGDAPFLGAVVLDENGLILAGGIEMDGARGEMLSALINTAVVEARRTSALLGLGAWTGLLLDCDDATIHVSDVAGGAVVLLAARGGAPTGWATRTAARARALARRFLEERP